MFLAQLPPPHHGQSAVADTVYRILRQDADLNVQHKWRGGAAGNGDVGKRSIGKYIAFLTLVLELIWCFVSGRRFRLAYLGMAPWSHTVLRDAILAGLAKLVAERTWVHVHGDGLERILAGATIRDRLVKTALTGTELIAITADTVRIGRNAGIFSQVIDLPNAAEDPGDIDLTAHVPLNIGCLGNLDPRKGVLDFVDAIDALTKSRIETKAAIVGGETAHLTAADLRQRIADKELSDRITVTGRVSEEEKSRILNEQDVFSLPVAPRPGAARADRGLGPWFGADRVRYRRIA